MVHSVQQLKISNDDKKKRNKEKKNTIHLALSTVN